MKYIGGWQRRPDTRERFNIIPTALDLPLQFFRAAVATAPLDHRTTLRGHREIEMHAPGTKAGLLHENPRDTREIVFIGDRTTVEDARSRG